jgi:hypothetical protein
LQKARADEEKLRRKLIFHSLYKGALAAHSGLHQMRSRRAFSPVGAKKPHRFTRCGVHFVKMWIFSSELCRK